MSIPMSRLLEVFAVCLASVVTKDNDEDARMRMGMAEAVFRTMRLFQVQGVGVRVAEKDFLKTYLFVWRVLLCGSEAWALRKD